jgi:hypothetical protein
MPSDYASINEQAIRDAYALGSANAFSETAAKFKTSVNQDVDFMMQQVAAANQTAMAVAQMRYTMARDRAQMQQDRTRMAMDIAMHVDTRRYNENRDMLGRDLEREIAKFREAAAMERVVAENETRVKTSRIDQAGATHRERMRLQQDRDFKAFDARDAIIGREALVDYVDDSGAFDRGALNKAVQSWMGQNPGSTAEQAIIAIAQPIADRINDRLDDDPLVGSVKDAAKTTAEEVAGTLLGTATGRADAVRAVRDTAAARYSAQLDAESRMAAEPIVNRLMRGDGPTGAKLTIGDGGRLEIDETFAEPAYKDLRKELDGLATSGKLSQQTMEQAIRQSVQNTPGLSRAGAEMLAEDARQIAGIVYGDKFGVGPVQRHELAASTSLRAMYRTYDAFAERDEQAAPQEQAAAGEKKPGAAKQVVDDRRPPPPPSRVIGAIESVFPSFVQGRYEAEKQKAFNDEVHADFVALMKSANDAQRATVYQSDLSSMIQARRSLAIRYEDFAGKYGKSQLMFPPNYSEIESQLEALDKAIAELSGQ